MDYGFLSEKRPPALATAKENNRGMVYGFVSLRDEEFPPIVHVETTNICNLQCIHCPQGNIYAALPNYKPKSITMALWRRIVDEVSQYPSALRLTPDGESLILKDFVDQMEYAYQKGIHTLTLNTNGMFLEGDKAEVLLQPSKTRVSVEVSLDALYKSSYDRIRVKSDYTRVWRNAMSFVQERDRRKLDNVRLMVSIVDQPELREGELAQFDEFWSQVVDKVIIRNYVDTKELTPKKMVDQRVVAERWPCPVVFTRLVVTWDGRIRFCPDDWLKTTTLATLDRAGSLKGVWQSKKFRELRRSHLEGTFKHPTCAKCTDWKVIRWGKDYASALEKVFSGAPRENHTQFVFDNKATTVPAAGE